MGSPPTARAMLGETSADKSVDTTAELTSGSEASSSFSQPHTTACDASALEMALPTAFGFSVHRSHGNCIDGPASTDAEVRMLRRLVEARTQGRRRRLRIAAFLLATMCVECVSMNYLLELVVEQATQDHTFTVHIVAQLFGAHRYSYGSLLHFLLLALVPTDNLLVRMLAAVVALSSLVILIVELRVTLSCGDMSQSSDDLLMYRAGVPSWCYADNDVTHVRASAHTPLCTPASRRGCECERPATERPSFLLSRAQRWITIFRLFAGLMFVVLCALCSRALAVRTYRVDGELRTWWRRPTHVALSQLWLALQVTLVWSGLLTMAGAAVALVPPGPHSGNITHALHDLHEHHANETGGGLHSHASAVEPQTTHDWNDHDSTARRLLIAYLLIRTAYVGLHLVFAAAPVRRHLQAVLGSGCLPLCGNDEKCAFSTIVGLLGSGHVPTALGQARSRFRAIRADVIVSPNVLRVRHDGSQLPLVPFARRLPLGECDAFISHAWVDPPSSRLHAMQRWHAAFMREHGRVAHVWLDQFCVDPSNTQADLACLGGFIAGCRKFVIVASPAYAARLWCVLELVTFLEMGGTMQDVVVVPLIGSDGPAHTATANGSTLVQPSSPVEMAQPLGQIDWPSEERLLAAHAAALEPLTRFDVRRSACHCPMDFSALLACIESAFGSHHCAPPHPTAAPPRPAAANPPTAETVGCSLSLGRLQPQGAPRGCLLAQDTTEYVVASHRHLSYCRTQLYRADMHMQRFMHMLPGIKPGRGKTQGRQINLGEGSRPCALAILHTKV